MLARQLNLSELPNNGGGLVHSVRTFVTLPSSRGWSGGWSLLHTHFTSVSHIWDRSASLGVSVTTRVASTSILIEYLSAWLRVSFCVELQQQCWVQVCVPTSGCEMYSMSGHRSASDSSLAQTLVVLVLSTLAPRTALT